MGAPFLRLAPPISTNNAFKFSGKERKIWNMTTGKSAIGQTTKGRQRNKDDYLFLGWILQFSHK